MEITSFVAGQFQLTACQKDDDGNVIAGTERVVADWFDNLITDAGMEALKGTNFLKYVRVGSGSTAPSTSDTALVSQVAVAAFSTIAQGPSDLTSSTYTYSSVDCSVQFGKGVAAGNLAEIGVSATATSSLVCRALIKDGTGTPTTITVLPIEYLTVTYRWRVYFDVTYTNAQTFTIGSTTYTATYQLLKMRSDYALTWANGDGLAGTGNGGGYWHIKACSNAIVGGANTAGTRTAATSVTVTNGSTGNYYKDYTATWNEAAANQTIKSFCAGVAQGNQVTVPFGVNITPDLVKTNTQTLTFSVRHAYARKSP